MFVRTRTNNRTIFTRTAAGLVATLTAGAVFATSTGAHAAEATHRTAATSVTAAAADAEAPDAEDAQVEALLKTMMSVPEEVLEKGDEATAAYLENMKKRPPRGWFSLSCMGAVSVAIGANLLPAAKIVKIVRVAKRVGIKRIVSAIKAIRKGNGHTLANDLQWVGAQLLGLEGVKAACS